MNNWSVDSLVSDALDAWSGENLPYTIAFWIAVAVLYWIGTRIYDRK
jgi:hypothetical protein